MIETEAKSSIIPFTKRATLPVSVQTKSQKLVLVWTISILMIEANNAADSKVLKESELSQISCISYLAQFDEFLIQVLINSSIKIDVMHANFATKLGFCIVKINMGAQIIDGNKLKAYEMIIVLLQIDDKDKKSCCFEETFLLTYISIDITFKMLF